MAVYILIIVLIPVLLVAFLVLKILNSILPQQEKEKDNLLELL